MSYRRPSSNGGGFQWARRANESRDSDEEMPAQNKILKRIATNAVREACEVRRGRLSPRALLAYQWLTDTGGSQQTWTLAWVCLELGWDCENWRAKALQYVHKRWRKLAWREFMGDLETRSRQVRALAQGSGNDYLPLVELTYWHEIANIDLPEPQSSLGLRFDARPSLPHTEAE